jgi:cyclopropane-fatty-acyl-phospholipid synthase
LPIGWCETVPAAFLSVIFVARRFGEDLAMVATPATARPDPALALSKRLLDRLFARYGQLDFRARFWDGTFWGTEAEKARCTLVLQHPGALRRMFRPPVRISLGEAYVHDDYDIEGDILAFLDVLSFLADRPLGFFEKLGLAFLLLRLPGQSRPPEGRGPANLRGRVHSVERDRAAVRYHYDLSNEFYALWLDQRMVYSCAYFHSPDEDIDTAQERKLDYICRKLRLRPGQKLLDIGCGWGGLVLHAAQKYGVDATGITLSPVQKDLADEWIGRAGLAQRCRVTLEDYREVPGHEVFDAVVSIGMAEHVGAAQLPAYFGHAARLLKRGGVFLNHAIGLNVGHVMPRGLTFAHLYIFPDGQLVHIPEMLRAAELAGFEVRDLESLRDHYALTLRSWVRRLDARADEAHRAVGVPSYRAWRLYMAGAEESFRSGKLNIYQTLLLKGRRKSPSGLPLTRDDWYRRSVE